MTHALLPTLVAFALLAPAPSFADEPVVVLDGRHLALTEDYHLQADAWKRWAEDFSRDMRASMGTMFGARLGATKLVKGAPYSAEVVTESNQALADGNVISRKTRGAVYRDGQGRSRQEMPGDGKEPTVFITDPVEGRNVILTPGSKRAIVTSRAEATPVAKEKEAKVKEVKEKQVINVNGRNIRLEDGRVYVDGKDVTGSAIELDAKGKNIRVENGKVTIDGKVVGGEGRHEKGVVNKIVVKTIDSDESPDGTRREEVRVQVLRPGDGAVFAMPPMPPVPPMPPGAAMPPVPPTPPMPPMPGVGTFRFESPSKLGKGVTTQLGTKDFDGVKAEGKSTVWTIPAGEIGNRNAINVSSESWYSPELQVTVYSRYNDPRTGESIYKLAGIRRGEPAPELFRVPADYDVKGRRERGNRHSQ